MWRSFSSRQLALRAVAALRQRQLQPYAAKNFKDILRLCDAHGVDHLTPVGATPLMLAARAGNACAGRSPARQGRRSSAEDEFGHTAWQHAVNRASKNRPSRKAALALLFERLGAGRSSTCRSTAGWCASSGIRASTGYLTLMLGGLKTQWSHCAARPLPRPGSTAQGFFAEQLHQALQGLPVHLWNEKRRKRSYVNQVLARAEVDSTYKPARKLWARTRNGHYLPNPAMLLRKGDGVAAGVRRARNWTGSIEAAATKAHIAYGRRQQSRG